MQIFSSPTAATQKTEQTRTIQAATIEVKKKRKEEEAAAAKPPS